VKTIKARKFRLHFNRINMQRGKDTVWTIHRSDRCIPARKVALYVDPIETHFKKDGRQPRAYLSGTGVVVDCGSGDFAIMSPQMAFALMRTGQAEGKETRFV
jgi:hypothetical protein